MSRDWLLYLDDLIDSAEKIGRFLQHRTLDAFSSDEMLFDAVLFNLEVIGEAVKKLPEGPRSLVPGADWIGPARMRDLIAHHYFSVDPQIVWEAATQRVPEILRHAKELRDRFDRSGEGSGVQA